VAASLPTCRKQLARYSALTGRASAELMPTRDKLKVRPAKRDFRAL
jgi:hypothetical protein